MEDGLDEAVPVRAGSALRKLAVAACLALALAACSTGDEKAPNPAAEAAAGEQFPNLASVPERPTPRLTEEERARIAEGLLADRANARHGDPVARSPIAPPPTATPQPPPPVSIAPAPQVSADRAPPQPLPAEAEQEDELAAAMARESAAPPAGPPVTEAVPAPPPPPAAASVPPPPVPPPVPAPVPPAPAAPAAQAEAPPAPAVPSTVPTPSTQQALTRVPPPPAELPATPPPPAAPRAVPAAPPIPPPVAASPQAQQQAPAPPPPPSFAIGDSNDAEFVISSQSAKRASPGAFGPPLFDPGMAGRGTPVATIFFASGSSGLGSADRQVLRQVATLREQTGGSVRVIGRASGGTGSGADGQIANFSMSVDRSQAVARVLIEMGIPAAVVYSDAVSDQGARPGDDPADRRVEIFLE